MVQIGQSAVIALNVIQVNNGVTEKSIRPLTVLSIHYLM